MLAILTLFLGFVAALALSSFWRRARIPAPLPQSLIVEPDEPIRLRRNDLYPDRLSILWGKTARNVTITLYGRNLQRPEREITASAERVDGVRVGGLDPRTRYMANVRIDGATPVTVYERDIPLGQIPNFRDLGGYYTQDGRQVKWNHVFRASSLHKLSDDDHATLRRMGVQLVCDLRTHEEVNDMPDHLPPQLQYLHLPATNSDNRYFQIVRLLLDPRFLPRLLPDLYTRVMIDENPQVFRQFFERLTQPENYPLIVHCAAGKDRTGIASAMLLRLLGVPDDTIIADYSLSNRAYEYFWESSRVVMQQLNLLGIRDRDFDYLLISDPDVMRATLRHLDERYGGVGAYLEGQGITPDQQGRIRELLLTDAHP